METSKPIIYFDGECGACNTFVQWMLERDKKGVFTFAPLQGETAKTRLPFKVDLSTVVLAEGDRHWVKSTAVLKALSKLGRPWKWLSLFLLVPRIVRDAAYDLFARHRYQLFGPADQCRFLTPEERVRFLS